MNEKFVPPVTRNDNTAPDVHAKLLNYRHENFQGKAGIPAFLVKIYVFSFLFMMFWAFLTRFPAFLLKVILMP